MNIKLGIHPEYGEGYYTTIQHGDLPCECWHFGNKTDAKQAFTKTIKVIEREERLRKKKFKQVGSAY